MSACQKNFHNLDKRRALRSLTVSRIKSWLENKVFKLKIDFEGLVKLCQRWVVELFLKIFLYFLYALLYTDFELLRLFHVFQKNLIEYIALAIYFELFIMFDL